MTYEAFRGSGLDLSAVGFMPGGEAYFCTPVGAAILGRAGVDGIHFCTAPETGDMILAVSPANGAEDCIHPVARDFPDFLRLLLACGDTAALEQSWMWSEEQFAAFLRENPPTPEGEAALAALRSQGVTPMEEPYRYLHALQAGFDPGVLRYSREYRELQQETEELPWRVSFHGGLIGHGGRAGKAIPADTWFTWEGETWYVPALYRCPEGIVVDLFQRVDVETMWAYCGKWKLTPETDWDAMPEERRCQAQAEHPFCQDFRAMLAVNGRGLRQRHGCSSVWLPLWPDREDRDMRAALQHYGLDTGDCWQLHRLSFEWTGEKPRKGKDFALILSGEETDVPGPSFQAERVGETVTFRHPVTGAEHTLTVRSIEPRGLRSPGGSRLGVSQVLYRPGLHRGAGHPPGGVLRPGLRPSGPCPQEASRPKGSAGRRHRPVLHRTGRGRPPLGGVLHALCPAGARHLARPFPHRLPGRGHGRAAGRTIKIFLR